MSSPEKRIQDLSIKVAMLDIDNMRGDIIVLSIQTLIVAAARKALLLTLQAFGFFSLLSKHVIAMV